MALSTEFRWERVADTDVYREGTTDLRASNSVTDAYYYSVSPGYLATARHASCPAVTSRGTTDRKRPRSPSLT